MDEIARRIGALSPAQLEELDRRMRARGPRRAREPVAARDPSAPRPLSFAQERLWFLDQLQPGTPVYNLPAAIRFPGPLDATALGRAVSELVRRHESLRTTFPVEQGKPVQRVGPAEPVPVPLADVRSLPRGAREAELQRLIAGEAMHVFDLARGPLVRALLIRADERDHTLVLTTHHIASDGWSTGILMQELGALYEAFAAGRLSPLPELPLQYSDYARQQREHLQGERLASLVDYWRRALDGAPRVLELPADRPRPAVQTFQGAWQAFTVRREVSDALADLSRREGVTLFMTLMAAFHALLFRYTGQTDLVAGTPIANRTRADIEKLIGFFVNTLVIRTRPGRELTFRELLGQVREVTLGAYAHQDLPFEKLVEELHPERTLSHNPLFQVMFVLQNAPAQAAGAPAEPPSGGPQPTLSKFDLTLSFSEHPDGLRGTVEYSTDLFDHATVTRLIGHLTTLLSDAAASPERRLSELALLTEPERRQVLVEWNDTRAGYPDGACAHELIEAQVDRAPEAKAVVFQDRSLTYRELDERANRLARRLIALGVGPEVKVGLCVERSLEMVVGALAILKAGGAYLPLDPTHPPRRLASILDQARAPVLVATRRSGSLLPQHGARVLLADEPGEGKAGRPARTATPDALAYVIHSSGSTGTPKGIEVPHRGLCNLAADLGRRFGVKPGERALQFFSLSFDAWMWDVLLALTAGATLHVAPDEARMSGPRLAEMLARDRIQVATLLPSLLALMPRVRLPDLHTLITGGEVCSADLVAAWAPGRRFFNTYGPTEVSIAATIARCEPGGPRPTIGRPISNTTAYVLDEGLAPVPIGVIGELYLGGCGVARGYLDRQDLTRERFLPDPFSTDPRARLFRTGDRARLTAAGEIEFLGRSDEQVKLRGVRIELGEIEAALRRHPSIGEAAVVIRDAGPDERRLLAYVAPAAGQAVVPGALRGFLRETLPAHMVPARFTVLERLPRLASGKIDARALPEPAPPDHADGGLVEPRTPAEREVAGIWQQVLGVARVGVHDNFFDLGGHSLAATRVLSQIQERWKVDLPLIRFFDAPTVAELAELVIGPRIAVVGDLEPQGAASLLARVDELSGPEVDALLEALGAPTLPPPSSPSPSLPSAGALLEQIDDLSDERVNALLTELMEAEAR